MKVKDLEIGKVYRTRGRYGSSDRVIVLDTGWDSGRYSEYSPLRPRKRDGARGIAVARECGFREDKYWTRDVLLPQQIDGPDAEVQARKAAEAAAARDAVARRNELWRRSGERKDALNAALRARFPDKHVYLYLDRDMKVSVSLDLLEALVAD